jgi:hypothetical protein
MKRLEIIANVSVEDALFKAFKMRGIAKVFTKIPSVHGVGSSGPRLGDHVWPEENFMLILYCEDNEGVEIERAVKQVKEQFRGEGIQCFSLEV